MSSSLSWPGVSGDHQGDAAPPARSTTCLLAGMRQRLTPQVMELRHLALLRGRGRGAALRAVCGRAAPASRGPPLSQQIKALERRLSVTPFEVVHRAPAHRGRRAAPAPGPGRDRGGRGGDHDGPTHLRAAPPRRGWGSSPSPWSARPGGPHPVRAQGAGRDGADAAVRVGRPVRRAPLRRPMPAVAVHRRGPAAPARPGRGAAGQRPEYPRDRRPARGVRARSPRTWLEAAGATDPAFAEFWTYFPDRRGDARSVPTQAGTLGGSRPAVAFDRGVNVVPAGLADEYRRPGLAFDPSRPPDAARAGVAEGRRTARRHPTGGVRQRRVPVPVLRCRATRLGP